MKSKKNIWNVVRHSTVIVLLFLYANGIKAQCPTEIFCDKAAPSRGLGLRYDVLPPSLNTVNTYLDFGVGDFRNGYYSGDYYHNDPSVSNTIFFKVKCDIGFSNIKITFNDTNHTYCTLPALNVNTTNTCRKYITDNWESSLKGILDPAFLGTTTTPCKQWEGECGQNGTIYRTGKVSIGSTYTNPNYMLAVTGKILTEQYKVQPCGSVWCDYVFDKAYKLMPLSALDVFIQTNKRLPSTKSAEEVKKDGGLDAAETLLNHQEKIEEIFLHLIDLEKQLVETKIKNH